MDILLAAPLPPTVCEKARGWFQSHEQAAHTALDLNALVLPLLGAAMGSDSWGVFIGGMVGHQAVRVMGSQAEVSRFGWASFDREGPAEESDDALSYWLRGRVELVSLLAVFGFRKTLSSLSHRQWTTSLLFGLPTLAATGVAGTGWILAANDQQRALVWEYPTADWFQKEIPRRQKSDQEIASLLKVLSAKVRPLDSDLADEVDRIVNENRIGEAYNGLVAPTVARGVDWIQTSPHFQRWRDLLSEEGAIGRRPLALWPLRLGAQLVRMAPFFLGVLSKQYGVWGAGIGVALFLPAIVPATLVEQDGEVARQAMLGMGGMLLLAGCEHLALGRTFSRAGAFEMGTLVLSASVVAVGACQLFPYRLDSHWRELRVQIAVAERALSEINYTYPDFGDKIKSWRSKLGKQSVAELDELLRLTQR